MASRTTAELARKPPDPKMAQPQAKREPIPIQTKRERFARAMPLARPPNAEPEPAAPIQRQQTPAAPAQVPPDVATQLAYAATVLRRIPNLPPDQAAKLDLTIAGSDVYNKIVRRNSDRTDLEQLRGRAPTLEEMGNYGRRVQMLSESVERETNDIQADLSRLHISSEDDLVRMVTEQFPLTWMDRGKQIANAMLDQNADVVKAEKARYADNVCTADTEGLRNADTELAGLAHEAEDLRLRRDAARDRKNGLDTRFATEQAKARDAQQGPLPGGVPMSSEELARLGAERDAAQQEAEDLQTQAVARAQQIEDRRKSYGQRFPVLYVPDYQPGSFSGSDPDALKNLTGQWLDKVLENIETTRGNIGDSVKIWDLRDVPQLAFQSLQVQPTSVLGQAVAHYIADKRSDEEALHTALTALAVVAGVIAAVATAGGALLVAAAATGVTLGLTLSQLILDIRQYNAEAAANQVALDPLIADISVNDPAILPIVMDVIALGLEAVAVVGVFRSAARATMAAGDVDALAAAARRSLPASEAEELINRTARRLGQTGGGRIQGPYTTLASRAGGTVFSDLEMTTELVAKHPNLAGLRQSLQRVDALLVEDSGIAAEANTSYVKVTGPDGQTFNRAIIRYNPGKATLADLNHEFNHLTDFRAGRIPPPYELHVDSADAFAQAQRRPIQQLVAEARVAGPRIADLPLPQAGEFQARKAVAEIRNSLRDIEEFVPRNAAGRIPGASVNYFEQQTRIIRRWMNNLESMVKKGLVPDRAGQALTEAERAAIDDTVRQYVNSQFPELPEEYARLNGGDFWASLQRQRNAATGGRMSASAWMQARTDRAGGSPMPDSARRPMERSFGHEFETVRIHADSRAGALADGIHADAFTRGKDIYFAPGKFQPDSHEGRRLLAHELTHVVQQRTGAVRDPKDTAEVGPLEKHAEKTADHVVSGKKAVEEVPACSRTYSEGAENAGSGGGSNGYPRRGALIAQIRQLRTQALFNLQTAIDNVDEASVRSAGQFAGVLWTVVDATWQNILHPPQIGTDAPVAVTVTPTGPPPPPPPPVPAAPVTNPAPVAAPVAPPETPAVTPPPNLNATTTRLRKRFLPELVRSSSRGVLWPVRCGRRTTTQDITVFLFNQTEAVAWVVKDTAALVTILRTDPIQEGDQWRAIGLLRQHFNPWEFEYMLAVLEARGLIGKFALFAETPAQSLKEVRIAVRHAQEQNLTSPSAGMALFRLMTRTSSIQLLQPLSPKELSTELFGDPDSWRSYLAPYNRSLLMGRTPMSGYRKGRNSSSMAGCSGLDIEPCSWPRRPQPPVNRRPNSISRPTRTRQSSREECEVLHRL